MFKYVSEILAQFSRSQKILALLLVLFSVVVINVSPSLISALTVDCKELGSQVERQNKRIIALETLVDSMDLKIRNNQRECTNEITSREIEFLGMLEELKKDAKIKERDVNYSLADNMRFLNSYSPDTLSNSVLEISPTPQTLRPNKNPMKGMIDKIERMQSKIKH